ncbi:N-acetyltransferase [Rouxiella silvae]|uniref:N-acetyltransferase n=1 Tax=Rouxiella silvae TaxID=1646373 RepID=A0AA40X3H8_9GAMM|nr:GNAT family N-acetyltransferase [Rouxiella silvae]KQN46554.1 histone acetyltransferase [Serratia sp. Leaf50]MBF6638021.1 GNAT family N-acetyltransferase [Rouxiella silvae]ORJ20112.1 N-acetyltransferase [Rouxiella silvae]
MEYTTTLWQHGDYALTSDKSTLDRPFIHAFLTRSTWAKGIKSEVVNTAIDHSLCFGLYHLGKQIGFARLVTDFATFGYLCDVFVIEEYQGKGLARWMMSACLEHPTLIQLRRIMLVTSTAAGLYEKVGYSAVNAENFVWQINRPDIYQQGECF